MFRLILKDIFSLSAQAVAFRMTVGADKKDTICLLTPMRPPSEQNAGSQATSQTIGIPANNEFQARRIGF